MNVTVVTSIYGAYDFVKKPLEQSVECDYVLVTDDDPGPCGWRGSTTTRQPHGPGSSSVTSTKSHSTDCSSGFFTKS